MPSNEMPRKMNGATDAGRSKPCARPQAAMAPPYFVIDRRLASACEPAQSTPPAQRPFPSPFPRAAGGGGVSIFPRRQEISERVRARRIDARGPALLAKRLRRARKLGAV